MNKKEATDSSGYQSCKAREEKNTGGKGSKIENERVNVQDPPALVLEISVTSDKTGGVHRKVQASPPWAHIKGQIKRQGREFGNDGRKGRRRDKENTNGLTDGQIIHFLKFS